jgi:hypothetical protein
LRQQARENVGGAARRERNHERHRSLRITLAARPDGARLAPL